MEVATMVILVLAIFVGIPAVIAIATAIMFRTSNRLTHRAKRIETMMNTATEAAREQTAETHIESATEELTEASIQVS